MTTNEPIIRKVSEDGKYRVKVYQQELNDFNPRIHHLNLSHMVCDHPKYFLGDRDTVGVAVELRNLCERFCIDWERNGGGNEMTVNEMINALYKCDKIVIGTISAREHSKGISVWYDQPKEYWDSANIGFGYMTAEDFDDMPTLGSSPYWREFAFHRMAIEMETYYRFLTHQVYYATLEKRIEPSQALKETPEWEEFLKDEWEDRYGWEVIEQHGNWIEDPKCIVDLMFPVAI